MIWKNLEIRKYFGDLEDSWKLDYKFGKNWIFEKKRLEKGEKIGDLEQKLLI